MRSPFSLLCALALASTAAIPVANAGGFPDPAVWTMPTSIMVVGQTGGVSDPLGSFVVIIRDLAMNPMPDVRVDVYFGDTYDVRLATVADPGVTVFCQLRTVQAITDQDGRARFSIRGGSRVAPATSYAATVRIYADGVLGAVVPVSTPDLDGINGVGAGDLAMWLEDFYTQLNPSRSDFNHDGFVGGGDLATWLQVFTVGGSTVSDPSCP